VAHKGSMSLFPTVFALENFWVYMLIQMIAMSDLDDALIILGLKTRITSLKMCIDLMINSTMLELTNTLVFSIM